MAGLADPAFPQKLVNSRKSRQPRPLRLAMPHWLFIRKPDNSLDEHTSVNNLLSLVDIAPVFYF